MTKRKGEGLFERIYERVKQIPSGKVSTYGEVARSMGLRDVRRVGQALHANPYEGLVPCHRVVTKDGNVSESFAFNGAQEQRQRLEDEGVDFVSEKQVDLTKFLFIFDS